MTFKPELVPEFLRNFEANKNSIRNFSGCDHLELWRDEKSENIYLTYSRWESEDALNQYRDSELFKSVWSCTKPLFAEKAQAFSSKKMEEVNGCVCRKKNLYSYLHPVTQVMEPSQVYGQTYRMPRWRNR